MNDEPALLAAIIASPDDDTPRLVYADFLDERGSPGDAHFAAYIRCQIAQVRDPDGPVHQAAREEIANHEWTWRDNPHNFGRKFPGVGFVKRRGFVEKVDCTAEVFFRKADLLLWNAKMVDLCQEVRDPKLGVVFEQGRLDWSFNKAHKDCPRCRGRGVTPRPCPTSAQPIRAVKITTDPRSEFAGWQEATTGEMLRSLEETYPGVEFTLPPEPCTGGVPTSLTITFEGEPPVTYETMRDAGRQAAMARERRVLDIVLGGQPENYNYAAAVIDSRPTDDREAFNEVIRGLMDSISGENGPSIRQIVEANPEEHVDDRFYGEIAREIIRRRESAQANSDS